MDSKIVQTILYFMAQYTSPMGLDWPKHWFEEVSVSQWAAGEMLNAILDHPMTPAEDTVEEFAIKMELYAASEKSPGPKRIFSIAAETAWEFLENV